MFPLVSTMMVLVRNFIDLDPEQNKQKGSKYYAIVFVETKQISQQIILKNF